MTVSEADAVAVTDALSVVDAVVKAVLSVVDAVDEALLSVPVADPLEVEAVVSVAELD